MTVERPWWDRWCLCEPRPPMVKPVEKCATCGNIRVTSLMPQRVGETRVSNGYATTKLYRGWRFGPAAAVEPAEVADERRA